MKNLTNIKINTISGGCECHCWKSEVAYALPDKNKILTGVGILGGVVTLVKEIIGTAVDLGDCAEKCFEGGKIFGKCTNSEIKK